MVKALFLLTITLVAFESQTQGWSKEHALDLQKKKLSLKDIKEMSHARLQSDEIISKIDQTDSIFNLTPSEVVDLKNSGVSEKVIRHMIKTSE